MMRILSLLVLLVFSVSAFSAGNESVKDQILKVTKIKPGKYALKSGGEKNCPFDGELELKEVEGGYSFMMGAILFVGGIGNKEEASEERGCKVLANASFKNGSATSTQVYNCDGEKRVYVNTISSTKTGFVLEKSFVGYKKNIDSKCEYKLQ